MFETRETPTHLEIKFHATDSANAFSLAASTELARLVKAHRRWQKPVVVRSAHPRVFCSGGNLSDYKKLKGRAPGLRVNREITRALDTFGAWPVVKLAVVEGDVFGGGMEWLARFDFRWCTVGAMFGFWQRRLGLSFGWGGGSTWSEILGGEAVVRSLLVEGRLLSSFEALRLGVVDRVGIDGVEDWCASLSEAGVMTSWTAAGERRLFEKLWLGPVHAAVLKRWRG